MKENNANLMWWVQAIASFAAAIIAVTAGVIAILILEHLGI